MDYLQVFELRPETGQQNFNQSIIHTQEQPPYRATSLVHAESPVSAKVFVIDDQTHCTCCSPVNTDPRGIHFANVLRAIQP